MTEEMRSRLLGMMMARVSRGVFPQREPIGYLYGHVAKEGETPTHKIGDVEYVGVVAPKLPEPPIRNDRKYLYFSVWYSIDEDSYSLDFFTKPFFKDDANFYHAENYYWCGYRLIDGEWGDFAGDRYNSSAGGFAGDASNRLLWSNEDILYKDSNNVYLYAIAPIPIYDRIGGDS